MPTPKKAKHPTWTVAHRDPTDRQRRRTLKKKADADRFLHSVEVAKLKDEFVDPVLGRTPFSE